MRPGYKPANPKHGTLAPMPLALPILPGTHEYPVERMPKESFPKARKKPGLSPNASRRDAPAGESQASWLNNEARPKLWKLSYA